MLKEKKSIKIFRLQKDPSFVVCKIVPNSIWHKIFEISKSRENASFTDLWKVFEKRFTLLSASAVTSCLIDGR